MSPPFNAAALMAAAQDTWGTSPLALPILNVASARVRDLCASLSRRAFMGERVLLLLLLLLLNLSLRMGMGRRKAENLAVGVE